MKYTVFPVMMMLGYIGCHIIIWVAVLIYDAIHDEWLRRKGDGGKYKKQLEAFREDAI